MPARGEVRGPGGAGERQGQSHGQSHGQSYGQSYGREHTSGNGYSNGHGHTYHGDPWQPLHETQFSDDAGHGGSHGANGVIFKVLALEPEPDQTWILNQNHITGSSLPDSVDPAQYPNINPDIRL